MAFVSTAMAFGVAAFAIPLVIHLLNRNRFQVVRWGAMHLLEPILRVNRRRIQIEQLILLLVRMAIPILLALCMAGPVLTGCHQLSGNAKTSLVVLLDNSYSMEAGGDATNLDEAKQQAAAVIKHQPRGSDLSLVLMAEGSEVGVQQSTTDLPRVSDELSELTDGFGPANVATSMEYGAKTLSNMRNAKRDIVIVSDFQANDWIGDAAASREQAMQMIRAMPLKPNITLLHTSKHVSDNVCISSVDLSPPVVGVGQATQIRVNLRNFGDVPYPSLRVYFQVDGEDKDVSDINLGSSEDRQVVFRHTFDAVGSHVVNVTIDADTLTADNSYQSVMQVWDKIPVLLVNGQPSDEPFSGETDFLEIALSPFKLSQAPSDDTQTANGTRNLVDLLKTTTIEAPELGSNSLTGIRVVVLANVARLSHQQLDQLKSFVKEGNALLVFSGNNIDADWYNGSMFADGAGLLPLRLKALRTSENSNPTRERGITPVSLEDPSLPRQVANEGGVSIVAEHFDHPALGLFNDPRNGKLSDAKINAWFRLESHSAGPVANPSTPRTADQLQTRPTVCTLARLDTGDVFLAEKQFGRGRVIQCSTSCGDAWSTLPVRPFYLPLMQQLVTYLATSVEPPRNVNVGQTIVATLPRGEAGKKVSVTTPQGERVEVQVQDKGTEAAVEFKHTGQRGMYVIDTPSGETLHFAVETSREESNLTQLDDDEMQALAESMEGSVVTSAQQYIDLDSTRRYGRDIWRQIFWMLLILIFAELVLEQFFTRKRTTSNDIRSVLSQQHPRRTVWGWIVNWKANLRGSGN